MVRSICRTLFSILFCICNGFNWLIYFSLTIAAPGYIITDPTLTKIEKERIWVIYIAAFFVIFFWAAFEQAGASLTYFAEEQTDRSLFGTVIPTSYFQSINAVAIVIFAPYLFGCGVGWESVVWNLHLLTNSLLVYFF